MRLIALSAHNLTARVDEMNVDFGSSDSDFQEVPNTNRSKANVSSTSGKKAKRNEENSLSAAPNAALSIPPGYIAELAKSGRAECKRCNKLIADKSIRIGIIVEGDWGIMTRWQHLSCTVFHKDFLDPNLIDGYHELDAHVQAQIKDRVLQSQHEVDQDDIPIDPDELVRVCWSKAAENPKELTLPLLPYQREGLGWMMHQENSEVHGGILADEMGMGFVHTFIFIFLILIFLNTEKQLRLSL